MNQVDAATRASLTAEDNDDEMLNMEDHDDRNNTSFTNEMQRYRKKNEKVVNALTGITEAPNELADYIGLLVSTQSQPHGKSSESESPATSTKFIRNISRTLLKDGMVTVSGSQLEQAVSDAVHYIVNPNRYNKNRINDGNGGEGQIRRSDNANHRKRKSFDNIHLTQRNNFGNNQIPPPSNIPRHDYNEYYSSRLHNHRGPSAQNPNFRQNPRSRPPPPPPPPPQRMNTQRSISPQDGNSRRRHQNQKSYLHQHNRHQNHHSSNQGNQMDRGRNLDHNQGHHRQGHGHDTHATFQRNNNKSLPPPLLPPPSATRKNHPHTHPPSHHHRNFNDSNEKSRIIFLTNIPPNVTHNQLMHYFTRKMNVNVINIDLKVEAVNHNRDHHKPDNQNPKVAYVELATHDQAMFIYHSPETVLGNRFIGIQIYHKQTHRSRNKNNSSSNNPPRINTQQPQKQQEQNLQNQNLKHNNQNNENKRSLHNPSVSSHTSYHQDKKSEEISYEHHLQSQKKQSKDYELIETYKKQQILLHKKESILEKQLTAHKKMFSLLKDKQIQDEISKTTLNSEENNTNENNFDDTANSSTEPKDANVTTNPKQQEKLKEILELQKKLNQAKKDRLESLSKINELQKRIDSSQNSQGHHNHRYRNSDIGIKPKPRRSYKLDKRTTILNISNLPADTPKDDVMDHFTSFGKVTNIEMKEKDSAEITFSARAFAERAKENGCMFKDSSIIIEWCNKGDGIVLDSFDDKINDSNVTSVVQNNICDGNKSKTKEETNIEQNDAHEENITLSTTNDIVTDEDDYINDDEARWR